MCIVNLRMLEDSFQEIVEEDLSTPEDCDILFERAAICSRIKNRG
jgi:hypothetical protein